MEIKVKAIKCEVSEKLAEFVDKKVSKIGKFFEGAAQLAEVTLEDLAKEGKKAKIQVHVPGDDFIVEKIADTFENAVTGCADVMKEKLTRAKEKKYDANECVTDRFCDGPPDSGGPFPFVRHCRAHWLANHCFPKILLYL